MPRVKDGEYESLVDYVKKLENRVIELKRAVRSWREYANKALDAGCITSMPGNEIPWSAGGEIADD